MFFDSWFQVTINFALTPSNTVTIISESDRNICPDGDPAWDREAKMQDKYRCTQGEKYPLCGDAARELHIAVYYTSLDICG